MCIVYRKKNTSIVEYLRLAVYFFFKLSPETERDLLSISLFQHSQSNRAQTNRRDKLLRNTFNQEKDK